MEGKIEKKRFSESPNEKEGKIIEIPQDYEHKKLPEKTIYKKYKLEC